MIFFKCNTSIQLKELKIDSLLPMKINFFVPTMSFVYKKYLKLFFKTNIKKIYMQSLETLLNQLCKLAFFIHMYMLDKIIFPKLFLCSRIFYYQP